MADTFQHSKRHAERLHHMHGHPIPEGFFAPETEEAKPATQRKECKK
jgi:hypothetical protein